MTLAILSYCGNTSLMSEVLTGQNYSFDGSMTVSDEQDFFINVILCCSGNVLSKSAKKGISLVFPLCCLSIKTEESLASECVVSSSLLLM